MKWSSRDSGENTTARSCANSHYDSPCGKPVVWVQARGIELLYHQIALKLVDDDPSSLPRLCRYRSSCFGAVICARRDSSGTCKILSDAE